MASAKLPTSRIEEPCRSVTAVRGFINYLKKYLVKLRLKPTRNEEIDKSEILILKKGEILSTKF